MNHPQMNIRFTYPILIFFLIILSCSLEEIGANKKTDAQHLVNSYHHYIFTGRILGAIANGSSSRMQNYTFHNVEATKIIYKTKTIDQVDIFASGIILIPKTTGTPIVVSYQHQGDLIKKRTAPSLSKMGANELSHAAIIVSTGFIVLVPDYLGYGDSKHKNHSFEHKASLAQNGLDFIKASKEYLNIKKIKTDNKISLVGYSEGALASLAMHQLIEKNEEILINKSIAGEGLFLKNIWVKDLLLNNQDHGDLKYFLKLVESYKSIYPKLSNSWNYYLTDVYSDIMNSGIQIDSLEFKSINSESVFNIDFINGVLSGKDVDFIEALAFNEIDSWETKSSVTLFYNKNNQINFLNQAKSFKKSFEEFDTPIKLKINEESLYENPVLPFILKAIEELHY